MCASRMAKGHPQPISPLVGEMPGRAEGGSPRANAREFPFSPWGSEGRARPSARPGQVPNVREAMRGSHPASDEGTPHPALRATFSPGGEEGRHAPPCNTGSDGPAASPHPPNKKGRQNRPQNTIFIRARTVTAPEANRRIRPQLSDYAITLPDHRDAVKDYFPINGKFLKCRSMR
jgi:hypothetical protein